MYNNCSNKGSVWIYLTKSFINVFTFLISVIYFFQDQKRFKIRNFLYSTMDSRYYHILKLYVVTQDTVRFCLFYLVTVELKFYCN